MEPGNARLMSWRVSRESYAREIMLRVHGSLLSLEAARDKLMGPHGQALVTG